MDDPRICADCGEAVYDSEWIKCSECGKPLCGYCMYHKPNACPNSSDHIHVPDTSYQHESICVDLSTDDILSGVM